MNLERKDMIQGIVRGKERRMNVREMAFCGLFTALIATGAYIQITIPVQPVPMHFTLQLLFALLAGFVMGARRGAMCVCIYLGIGLAGVPVFAAGGGPAYILRPTFGFLLGFAFAAWVTGIFAGMRRRKTFFWNLWSAIAGMMAYYVSGMVYFYFISNYVLQVPVGWKLVFINCFALTVVPDAVLCVLAAILTEKIRPAIDGLFGD